MNARSISPDASATRASPRAEIPSQHGSPIWQARANDCSRHAEASSHAALGQPHLTEQRLRPGQEGQPVVAVRQLDSRAELFGGLVERAAEQVDAPEHRQAEGLSSRLEAERERRRLLEQGRRAGVLGAVAGDGTQIGHRLGEGGRRAGPCSRTWPKRSARS